MPTWGSPMLAEVDFDDIHYFVRASERSERSWDDVPEDVKKTFDRLGIPEAERKFLAGVGAQYESEVVYHQVNEELEKQGVIFTDMDTALKEHPDLLREYFATIIPPNDNKLAALNSAVWSGGSFVYVPPGVHVEMPLQAYFRINTENMGQFERTLIIADEGSYVHYVEGCTAPTYSSDSLHSAVVELIAKPGARIRYTTVQNWSNNVFNLVTKRAVAEADATVEWVDCNLGSKLTMKYPAVYLMGERRPRRDPVDRLRRQRPAPGRGRQDRPRGAQHDEQHLRQVDLQGRRALLLPRPARGGQGRARRALARSSATPCCSTRQSRSDTYPTIRIGEDDVDVGHEATVSKVGEEQLFYLQSHGIAEEEASQADRQRLHRADRQGAADGVRGRDEPPDRAADGGLDRMTDVATDSSPRRRTARAATRCGAIVMPAFRGTPGWEFTPIDKLELDAFAPAPGGEVDEPSVPEGVVVLPLADGRRAPPRRRRAPSRLAGRARLAVLGPQRGALDRRHLRLRPAQRPRRGPASTLRNVHAAGGQRAALAHAGRPRRGRRGDRSGTRRSPPPTARA